MASPSDKADLEIGENTEAISKPKRPKTALDQAKEEAYSRRRQLSSIQRKSATGPTYASIAVCALLLVGSVIGASPLTTWGQNHPAVKIWILVILSGALLATSVLSLIENRKS